MEILHLLEHRLQLLHRRENGDPARGEDSVSLDAGCSGTGGGVYPVAWAFARLCGDEVCRPATWGRVRLVPLPQLRPPMDRFSPPFVHFTPEPHTWTKAMKLGAALGLRRAGVTAEACALLPGDAAHPGRDPEFPTKTRSCWTGVYISARRCPRRRPPSQLCLWRDSRVAVVTKSSPPCCPNGSQPYRQLSE